MSFASIQRLYHSSKILLDVEKSEIEKLYANYVHENNVSKDTILRKCICHRHFRFLHINASQRDLFVNNLISKLKENKVLSPPSGDFEDLYNRIFLSIGKEKGIGRTMLYDITRMIGFCHSVYPQKYVYLHAGSKIGAKRLLKKNRLPFRVHTSDFLSFFPNEESLYIEDILCIFKDKFDKF